MFDQIPLVLAQQSGPGVDKPQAIPEDPVEGIGQTTERSDPQSAPTEQPRRSPGMFDFLPIILIFGVIWFLLMGNQRRDKKKRTKMLAALAKGNKVQTVGGIIGNVVEVRENDVVLKVDENANIRLRFSRSAIQIVLEDKDTPS